jgi:hypothetical protein
VSPFFAIHDHREAKLGRLTGNLCRMAIKSEESMHERRTRSFRGPVLADEVSLAGLPDGFYCSSMSAATT